MEPTESLQWHIPESSPDEIVRTYAKLVRQIPDVKVWARVDGTRVHLITAVPDKREFERAVYAAELQMMDRYGSEAVSFDVYRASMPAEEAAADARLVLSSN